MDSVEALETILKYSFANKSLLKDALGKKAGAAEKLVFKRLEFLGDSVLNVAFTSYLHLTFPDLSDGELNDLVSVNTCNETFARVALRRGLSQFIVCRRGHYQLQKVQVFSDAVSKEDDIVWHEGSVPAPKFLADFVEAIAAAVYIDVDFDLQRFWEVFKDFLEPIFTRDDVRRRFQPLDTLVRLGKKRVGFGPLQKVERSFVVNVYFDGEFIASGYDKTVDLARIAAAKEALQKLSESMPIQNILHDPTSLDVKNRYKKVKGKKKVHSEEKNNLQMDSVERILNYSFLNKSLLKNAITHKSGIMSRLQHLGKTALGLVFTKYLYFAFPDLTTTGMDFLRGVNRSAEKYARVALKHGFHKLLIFSQILDPSTLEEVKLSSKAVGKADGPILPGGLVIDSKILSGIVPSLVGAVYVDVNFNVSRLWEICKGLFEPFDTLDDLQQQPQSVHSLGACGQFQCIDSAKLTAAKAARRSKLLESKATKMVVGIKCAKMKLVSICQKRKWSKPIYSVVSEDPVKGSVCSVEIETQTKEGTLFIKGDSRKKRKLAESNSALHMLRALKIAMDITENTKIEEETVAEIEDAKDKLYKYCNTRKWVEPMYSVVAEDPVKRYVCSVEIECAKDKLWVICKKRKWSEPIYSVVSEDLVKGYACSVEIETPTEEGTLFIKGDSQVSVKQAERNSASHMLRALEFYLKDAQFRKYISREQR